jgi:hypothetical protein
VAALDIRGGALGAARARREPVLGAALAGAAALATLGAAHHALHGWRGYVYAFVATAAGQALLAAALAWRPRPAVALAGIAGNAAVVAFYLVSRTEGIPWGAHAYVAEEPSAPDVAATALELAVIGVLVALLPAAVRRWTANALLLVGALFWYLRFTNAF